MPLPDTSRNNGALERIRAYFQVREKGSSLRTEMLAGLSTFLVLSYIFVVNPAILSQAGMDRSSVLFATILVSGGATLAMGLWARLPYVLAPGMEMNAYIAFFVVGSLGLTWQEALGAVFWSGVLFVILSVAKIRQKIIDAIPDRMKTSLSLSVGVFLVLVAFKISGVLRFEGVRVVGLGQWTTPEAVALYIGLAIVLILDRFRVRAAVIISISAATIVAHEMGAGGGEQAAQLSWHMFSAVGALDFGVIARPTAFSVILVLFLIDFYGSVAKLIGLAANTSIQEGGRVPRMNRALLVDSVGTTAAAGLGTSNITVYVESAVGIGAGGRTGLTAVTCGVLMLACFALAPVLHWVPLAATTGALVFVAVKLFPPSRDLRRFTWIDSIAMFLMQVVVVATFALDRAIFVGLVTYVASQAFRREQINRYALVSIMLLGLGIAIQ